MWGPGREQRVPAPVPYGIGRLEHLRPALAGAASLRRMTRTRDRVAAVPAPLGPALQRPEAASELVRPSRRSGRRLLRLLPAAALLGLGPLFYHRLLTPGWALADYDVVVYFVPYRAYLAHAWQQGRWLPLWNSH